MRNDLGYAVTLPIEDVLITQIIPLKNRTVQGMKKALLPMLSPHAKTVYLPSDGTIMITDYAPAIRKILKIVRALDVRGSDIDNYVIARPYECRSFW